jgi:sugar phosphate isomerase/epimerase
MITLGIQSAILGELPFDELIGFASANDFACVELMCWPYGKDTRKYAGVTHIDVETIDIDSAKKIHERLKAGNVFISGLGYYPNPLDPDPDKSEFFFSHIRKVIDAATILNVGIVNTFIGADPSKHNDDNLARFREIWPPLVKYAEEKNIKIAIENCPMYFTRDEWPSGKNLAHSPALWRKIFDAIPSPNFGLNYDPSHLVWQMMDYVKPVFEFREKIFHVHIKDAKIRWDKINEEGILVHPNSIHTPKLPGLGDINWGKFFSALYEAGYKGSACIEVEDKAFEGSVDDRKTALLLSRNFLRQFLVH